MKFIHTGDWHIGKIVNEFSMLEDQKFILDELFNIIQEENPDALVIAGDIYDRSIPPVEAVDMLNDFLKKVILEKNIKVMAISGNHDSGERISFGSYIMKDAGLYIEGKIKKSIVPIVLKDEFGEVEFYLLPYGDPVIFREEYSNPDIRTHMDAMEIAIEGMKNNFNPKNRRVIVTHGYVTKGGRELYEGETSESEKPLSIGGTSIIDSNIFNDFNYVALGHLHGSQRVDGDRVMYSGSLLKYSLSEENHKKGVWVIDMDGNGEVQAFKRELRPRRDLRRVKGNFEDLLKYARNTTENCEDYIFAFYEDDENIIDPIGKLREVYPNIMHVDRVNKVRKTMSKTSAGEGHKNKTKLELFKDFYENMTSLNFTEEKELIMKTVIEMVEKEEG